MLSQRLDVEQLTSLSKSGLYLAYNKPPVPLCHLVVDVTSE